MLSTIDTGPTEIVGYVPYIRSWVQPGIYAWKTNKQSQSTNVRFHLGRMHLCQPEPDLLLLRESRLHALYAVDEWLNKTSVSDYMDFHELKKWKNLLYIVSDTCVSFIYRWHSTVIHVNVWIAFGLIPDGYFNTQKSHESSKICKNKVSVV